MSPAQQFYFWSLLLLNLCINNSNAQLRFNNFKCITMDEKHVIFPYCDLKVLGRGLVGLSMRAKILDLPLVKMIINLSLWKKESGYRPFMYNFTTEFCSFMSNRKRYPFIKIFFDSLLMHSNLNHTCPYNHDMIVTNMTLSDSMLKGLPFPAGDYLLVLATNSYNRWTAEFKVYLSYSEHRK